MSEKIEITKDEIDDWLYDASTIKIGSEPLKHDYHTDTYVTKRGEKYYMYDVIYSYNEGMISYDYYGGVQAVEVTPVEKITIDWKVVK